MWIVLILFAAIAHAQDCTSTRDLRGRVFEGGPRVPYPIKIYDRPGQCVLGGRVNGTYAPTASWSAAHDPNNAAMVTRNSARMQSTGFRAHNVGDGFRPASSTNPFTIRRAHFTQIRDDCIENDRMNGGLVDDVLFNGCYVVYSARHPDSDVSGSSRTVTIRNSLLYLKAFPKPHSSESRDPGHGALFKLSSGRSPRFVIENNIFRADISTDAEGNSGISSRAVITRCSNNVYVWTGSGSFPGRIPLDPNTRLPCFTVTRDVNIWNNAVAAWRNAHPEVPE